MKIGDTFSSYEEFNTYLAEYTQRVHYEYWIRDTRTIVNQRKRYPDTVNNAKDSLKYYYVVIACIRGGRKYEPKQENSIRNCSTAKLNCPASIHLHMSSCGQFLTVTRLCESHNHSTSKAYLRTLPRQRIHLPSLLKGSPREILKAGGFKKSNVTHLLRSSLSKQQKFRLIDEQGKIMAQLCSELPTSDFYERLNFIKRKIKEWSDSTSVFTSGNETINNISEDITDNDENIEDEQGIKTRSKQKRKNNNRAKLRQKECLAKSARNGKGIKKPTRTGKRGRPKGYGKTTTLKKKNNASRPKVVLERNSLENVTDVELTQEESENYVTTEHLEIDEDSENDITTEHLEIDEDSESYFEEYLDEDCFNM